MKTVRSNRYRRRRRRDDRTRMIILIGILAGIVLVVGAAAVVTIFLLLRGQTQKETPAQEMSTSSQTESALVSEQEDAYAQIIAINPNAATAKTTGKLAYQSLYPELYVPIVEKISAKEGAKVCYLTFDEGPSALTEELLAALQKADCKATFFVTCHGKVTAETKERLQKIARAGHAIGILGYSSDRQALYASVEDYLADFYQMSEVIYEATGEKPTIFRFPGGSYCAENSAIYKELIAEMERRGFTYFDWNVDSGDSGFNVSKEAIYNTVVEGITTHNKSIVLLSNAGDKKNTVSQIPAIVKKAKKEGYTFYPLDPSVKPFSFANPE